MDLDITITAEEREQLKRAINQSETVDNTEYIRKMKQSYPLANDVRTMERLKQENAVLRQMEPENFRQLCESHCRYLFDHHSNIFNKLLNDEIDLTILQQYLQVLQLIELGEVDQHEGSVIIGKLLQKIYLDSATRRSQKLDEENPLPEKNTGANISWKDFKRIQEIKAKKNM